MPTLSRTVNQKPETSNNKQETKNKSYRLQVKSGFTLIELLVVITLIGILASLTLASYGGAQAKARDGVRKSDLAQIKRALELAKSDCQGNAYYPFFRSTANTKVQAVGDFGTSLASGTTTLRGYLTATALKYMSSVPLDPKDQDNSGSGGSDNRYQYNVGSVSLSTVCPDTLGNSNSQYGAGDYLLTVQLERQTDADARTSYDRCVGKPNIANYWNGTGSYPGWYFVCNN